MEREGLKSAIILFLPVMFGVFYLKVEINLCSCGNVAFNTVGGIQKRNLTYKNLSIIYRIND